MAESTIDMQVTAIHAETEDIRRFDLQRVDGARVAGFAPGAHIDLHLGPGLIRQYSLCNGPDEGDRYVIAVKKETASRGGSLALHERIQVGDVIPVTGPRNHFPLAADATEHLLLAGGIGVTPLLSMARHLKAAGKPFRMKYFTRSPAHTAFHADLGGKDWATEVDFHHAIEPDRLRDHLQALLSQPPAGGHVYVCGPRPFMELAIEVASAFYPKGSVHSEYFSADPAAQAGSKSGFRLRCARSEKELDVEDGESMLDVLSRNGIQVEVMCEQGVCGTCLTGVLQGRPDHRDSFLTDDERAANDRILVCCSRSLDPLLVLDL
ncbi:PDR/VanB family oxidoreductase [Hydrogenophaga sp.]|uniref:PDR/VanB family oxidoreductase n=1 Tax=Hydrogenophaga sp. TaxID=1904254 RepID=UPI003F701687